MYSQIKKLFGHLENSLWLFLAVSKYQLKKKSTNNKKNGKIKIITQNLFSKK